MRRLTSLVPLLVAGLATPVLAGTTLTLDTPSSASSAGLSMSAPPSLDSSSSASSQPSQMSSASSLDMSSSAEDGASDDGLDEGNDSIQPPAGPPVASRDALSDFYAACNAAASGVVGATGQLADAGWIANEDQDAGPFNTVYSGYRDFNGLGEVDIWGALQTYPTQRLGYCRVDFSDPDGIIDFKDMNGLAGLVGKVEDLGEGGVFGAFESADKHVLVIGDRVDGTVEIEFNFLLGDAPKS